MLNVKDYGIFGSIVFSPPYFDALSVTKGGGSKTSILYEETTRELQMKRSGPFAVKKNLPTPYSSRVGNIGNVKEQSTYLEEMLKVYRECYRILKPSKFMVVVVKDIQRNWKIIPLGADTIADESVSVLIPSYSDYFIMKVVSSRASDIRDIASLIHENGVPTGLEKRMRQVLPHSKIFKVKIEQKIIPEMMRAKFLDSWRGIFATTQYSEKDKENVTKQLEKKILFQV